MFAVTVDFRTPDGDVSGFCYNIPSDAMPVIDIALMLRCNVTMTYQLRCPWNQNAHN